MPSFLHVADVHLGFDRYESPERTKDFFYAFRDVLQRYAVEAAVDFVLIAGDLFEHRTILPNTLNQAELALGLLKQAGIPVLAIEGNHDNCPYGVKTSWLRYLADHDFLRLLEPIYEPETQLLAWSDSNKRGGYCDLPCGVRVIGSNWYGSSAPKAIDDLAKAIHNLPKNPTINQTILMFHHGLEGQIARYQGALRYADLMPLREAGIDYLALGHIHKSYTVEGWIFNPGSLEANSIAESEFERGAYYVHLSPGFVQAKLIQDHQQRPCYRLDWEAKGRETLEEIQETILTIVQQAVIPNSPQAIVEFKLKGQVGIPKSSFDERRIKQDIQQITHALIVIFRWEAKALDFDLSPATVDDNQRMAVETQVYHDLLASHAHYRKRSQELANVLLDLKEQVIDGQPERVSYERLGQAFLGNSFGMEEA
ncbi:MAG: exonuclease SbcCD subunit D [Cyanobacteriota bacterium]|nr:exonuclease SbcCD subunit D [Cyanobacteriota bacterium]